MEELQKTLTKLLARVEADSQLDTEDKNQLIMLINDVVADPTPNNLEALGVVLEELGKSQEYLAALEIVENYKNESSASGSTEETSEASQTEGPSETPPPAQPSI